MRGPIDEKVAPWYLWQLAMQHLCLTWEGEAAVGVFFVYIPKGRGGPDWRAVQIDDELIEQRAAHLEQYVQKFVRGEPQPEHGWGQTPAGIEERKREMAE